MEELKVLKNKYKNLEKKDLLGILYIILYIRNPNILEIKIIYTNYKIF